MNTHLTADEINRDATELIRRVLQRFDSGTRWLAREKRSELLGKGYSALVVSKAEEFDLRDRIYAGASAVFVGLHHAILNSYNFSRPLEIFILWLGYLIHRYRKGKLSDADNKLVWEELNAKAIVEPAPRPFLWRLDALLRGRR